MVYLTPEPTDKNGFRTVTFVTDAPKSGAETIRNGILRELGLDALLAPWFWNMNVELSRTFTIKERLKLQFRAESFDSLNHPIFNSPSVTADSSAFGTITSTIAVGTPARQNQFALRLLF